MNLRDSFALRAPSLGIALALVGWLMPVTGAYADGASEFERQCVAAWSKALPNRPASENQELCRCGLTASVRSGVSDTELSAEAERVRRDPVSPTPNARIRRAIEECLNDMLAAAAKTTVANAPEPKR